MFGLLLTWVARNTGMTEHDIFFILVGVVGTCHAQPVQYLWPFLWVYWRAWSHLSALKENSDLSLNISCAYVNTHSRTQILLKSMLWFTLIVHCEHTALQVHFAFWHCFLAQYVCHWEMTGYVTWTLQKKKKSKTEQNGGNGKDVGCIFGNGWWMGKKHMHFFKYGTKNLSNDSLHFSVHKVKIAHNPMQFRSEFSKNYCNVNRKQTKSSCDWTDNLNKKRTEFLFTWSTLRGLSLVLLWKHRKTFPVSKIWKCDCSILFWVLIFLKVTRLNALTVAYSFFLIIIILDYKLY